MSKIKITASRTKIEAIQLQASILFKQKGYTGSSMKDIAVQMGIEAPSLYNHISRKTDLLVSICFGVAVAFEQEIKRTEALNMPAGNELEEMLRFHVEMILQNYTALWVANHEYKHLPEADLKKYIDMRRAYENKMQSLIEKGMAKKVFRTLNAKLATLTILASLRGLEFWKKEKQATDLKFLEDNIIQQLLYGIIQ